MTWRGVQSSEIEKITWKSENSTWQLTQQWFHSCILHFDWKKSELCALAKEWQIWNMWHCTITQWQNKRSEKEEKNWCLGTPFQPVWQINFLLSFTVSSRSIIIIYMLKLKLKHCVLPSFFANAHERDMYYFVDSLLWFCAMCMCVGWMSTVDCWLSIYTTSHVFNKYTHIVSTFEKCLTRHFIQIPIVHLCALSPPRAPFLQSSFSIHRNDYLFRLKLKSHMISFHCYRVWRTTAAATIAIAITSKSSSNSE